MFLPMPATLNLQYENVRNPHIFMIVSLIRNFQFQNALKLANFLKDSTSNPHLKKKLKKLSVDIESRIANTNSRKVDFLVIGAQKAGTTALFRRLEVHPEICVPAFKELHYFDSQGISATHANYHRCFHPEASSRILAEVTPSYLYLDGVLEQIHTYRPDIKLMVMLRDPIERAISQFNMLRASGRATHTRLNIDYWLQHHEKTKGKGYFDLIGRGLYAQQLDEVFRLFPRENVLLVRSEDFRTEPESTLASLSSMLGVGPFPSIENTIYHVGSHEQVLTAEDYKRLQSFYRKDCLRLHEEYGVDTSHWLRRIPN